jgi:hypothetical protein
MKVIADDEEDSSIILGGAMSEEDKKKKSDYLSWCYGLVEAKRSGDTAKQKEYCDKLLDYLKTRVLQEIDNLGNSEKEEAYLKEQGYSDEEITKGSEFYKEKGIEHENINKRTTTPQTSLLFSQEEVQKMKEEAEKMWSDPNFLAETDYLVKLNVMSLLCCTLFEINSKNYNKPYKYNTDEAIQEINFPIFGEDYITIKNKLFNEQGFVVLGDGNISVSQQLWTGDNTVKNFKQICLVNALPFITISDILSAFLEKNVWFLGFSTHFILFDDKLWTGPFGFPVHDIAHLTGMIDDMIPDNSTFFNISIPISYDRYSTEENDGNKEGTPMYKYRQVAYVVFNKIKDFYVYCEKNAPKGDKGVKLYSIKLLLFYILHENPEYTKFIFGKIDDPNTFKELVESYVTPGKYRFNNPDDLGGTLFGKFRTEEFKNKPESERLEDISDYLKTCVSNFVDVLYEFQKKEGITTGGRKTKRRRSKKTIRKRRKSRKSRK